MFSSIKHSIGYPTLAIIHLTRLGIPLINWIWHLSFSTKNLLKVAEGLYRFLIIIYPNRGLILLYSHIVIGWHILLFNLSYNKLNMNARQKCRGKKKHCMNLSVQKKPQAQYIIDFYDIGSPCSELLDLERFDDDTIVIVNKWIYRSLNYCTTLKALGFSNLLCSSNKCSQLIKPSIQPQTSHNGVKKLSGLCQTRLRSLRHEIKQPFVICHVSLLSCRNRASAARRRRVVGVPSAAIYSLRWVEAP